MNFKVAIVFLQMLTTSYGDFELACDPVNPSVQTDVTCVCRRTVGSGIKWFFNGNLISDCILNSVCLPQPIGYTFSINTSEFEYEMTKSAYDYNDCTQINCTDASNTNVQLMVVPSAINFDQSNPPTISEPALSHNNGNISISTGCISGYTDVTCEWFTVYNLGKPEEYTDGQFAFNENDKSACSNCNNDVNAKRKCGFYHIEASGNETRNVNFRVVVTHTPTNLKWEVNSANVYTVKVNKPSGSDESPFDTVYIVLICVFVGIAFLFFVVIIMCFFCVRPTFTKIELWDTEIYLEWTDSLNCCCKRFFGYNIVRHPKQRQVMDFNCLEKSTKEKHCTMENLDPMAIYEISLCRTLYCCKSLATVIYVKTRTSGMPNDQRYCANTKSIDVQLTETDLNPEFKVTCNGYKRDTAEFPIEKLTAYSKHKIEVFAIHNGMNVLLFAEKISSTPIKVCRKDVSYNYVPEQNSVKCNINWEVSNKPQSLNESDKFHFYVICRSNEQWVHIGEKITNSNYDIPHLHLGCSYTAYVYVIYNSIQLEPPVKIKLTPYKPTNLKHIEYSLEKSTMVTLEWERPENTENQDLQYQVICDKVVDKTSSKKVRKIFGLVPGETYEFKIFTIINLMKSQPLVEKITTAPRTPINLTYTATSSLVELNWEKPKISGNKELQYKVTFNEVTLKITSETSCKIGNLDPSQIYHIEIFSIIDGKKSLPLKEEIRTQDSLPPIGNGQQPAESTVTLDSAQYVSEKALPPIGNGQQPAESTVTLDSAQYVSEKGKHHSNKHKRNNVVSTFEAKNN